MAFIFYGAGDEARTRYLHLGKVALYRMSYTREQTHYSTSWEFVNHFFQNSVFWDGILQKEKIAPFVLG